MTGGGTGGHLSIIESIKNELKNENLFFIGSKNGQDILWFENDKIFQKTYFLNSKQVVNKTFIGKIILIFKLIKLVFQAMQIIKKHKIDKIFSVGGYSSAPASFASIILRIPLIIHEQNSYTGSLNRILKRFVKKFISSYENSNYQTSYPVSLGFFEQARIRKDIKNIIFLGGSQGAETINELALSLALELNKKNINIIHQAGEKHINRIKNEYQKLNLKINIEIFGFTNNILSLMSQADLAISRSGASILWELTANQLPAIFIPYPYAAGNHQFHNANFLVKKKLAWMFENSKIDKKKILEILDKNIETKSINLSKIVDKNGIEDISNIIMNIS